MQEKMRDWLWALFGHIEVKAFKLHAIAVCMEWEETKLVKGVILPTQYQSLYALLPDRQTSLSEFQWEYSNYLHSDTCGSIVIIGILLS